MADFISLQKDYLLLICGLGYFYFASLSFSLRQNVRNSELWWWLGLSGIFQGAALWVEMISLVFPFPSGAFIRTILLAMAFVSLMEGARRGSRVLTGREFSAFVYYLWLIIPMTGWLAYGLTGVEVFIRFCFGLMGGACYALVLWLSRERVPSRTVVNDWLGGVCCMVFLQGVVQCIAQKGSFFPVDRLNSEGFLELTGVPVQAVSIGILILGLVCLWRYSLSEGSGGLHRSWDANARWIGLLIFVAIVGGWAITEQIGRSSDRSERKALMNIARAFASGIQVEQIRELEGNERDEGNPRYRLLKSQAQKLENSIEDIRYIYLFGRRENKIFFYFDSESDRFAMLGGKKLASPGDLYEELTPGLVAAFDNGQEVFEGPYLDPWGSLFSALVPLKDPHSGSVVAVLGVDIEARDYDSKRFKQRSLGIVITALILAILIVFLLIQRRGWEMRDSLRASERKLKSLFDEMSSGMAVHEPICDDHGEVVDYRILDVNPAFERLTGMSREHVIGKAIREIDPGVDSGLIRRCGKIALEGGVDQFEQYSVPLRKYFDCRVFSPEQGRFAITFEDITSRKEAMEQLATLSVRLQNQREVAVIIARKIAEESADDGAALRFLTEASAQALAVERVGVWLGGDQAGYLECVDIYQASLKEHTKGMLLAAEQYPLYFKALANGEVIDSRDVQRDLRTGELAENYFKTNGISSSIEAPIMIDGKVIGVLRFENAGQQRSWHTDEIRFASEVADQVEQLLLVGQRKTAMDDLARNCGFLQTLIDTIPNPVYFKDSNLRYQGCNKAFSDYLGFAREDIVGKTVFSVAPAELAEIYSSRDAELMAAGGSQTYEGQVRAAGGMIREVIFYKAVWGGGDGRSAGIVGIIVDITDRKRAESALMARSQELEKEREGWQILFDSIPFGLLLLNESRIIVRANNAVAPLTGKALKEMVGGRLGQAICCIHSFEEGGCGYSSACPDCPVLGMLGAVLGSGRDFEVREVCRTVRSGSAVKTVWFEVSAKQIIVAGERHILIAMNDISRRKEREQAS